jgi:hypothetical protein
VAWQAGQSASLTDPSPKPLLHILRQPHFFKLWRTHRLGSLQLFLPFAIRSDQRLNLNAAAANPNPSADHD